MAKGRQIGQTKKMCKILDEAFGPYEIHMEENQFVLIDTRNHKPLGYYGDMGWVINKITQLNLVNLDESYTLAGFLESFNNIKNQLLKSFEQFKTT